MSDFDSLVHIEQTFYDSGFTSGYAHGKIHGVIEGRALGKEKGYEMWEEIAFYEGFARGWEGLMRLRAGSENEQGQVMEAKKGEDRATQHIRHLLSLTSQFPSINPSSSSTESIPIPSIDASIPSQSSTLTPSTNTMNSQPSNQPHEPEIDIPKLQRQIRSRYKALCSTLGVRPRLYTASDSNPDSRDGVEDELDSLALAQGKTVRANDIDTQPIDQEEGSTHGEARTSGRGKGFIPVWKVDAKGEKKKVTNMDLSF